MSFFEELIFDKNQGIFISPTKGKSNIIGNILIANDNNGKLVWKKPNEVFNMSDIIETSNLGNKHVPIFNGIKWISERPKLHWLEDFMTDNAKEGDILKFKSGKWIPSGINDSGIKNINGQSGINQTITVGTRGDDVNITSNQNIHTIHIPTVNKTKRGLLSCDDFSLFHNKLNSNLLQGNIYIGNNNDIASARTIVGDITISSSGKSELVNISSLSSGEYNLPILTVDSKGRIIKIANGVENLSVINGLSNTTQYLKTGTDGIDFNIISTDNTHIFNIPNASEYSRGLLNISDYIDFKSKMDNKLSKGFILIGNENSRPKEVKLTGDITISSSGLSQLSNTSVIPGIYGRDNKIPMLDIDSKGRIVKVSEYPIDNLKVTIDISNEPDTDITVSDNDGYIINVPDASETQRGLLIHRDFNIFKNKLNSELKYNSIFIGNKYNIPTQVKLHGDVTLSSDGTVKISDNGVIPGEYAHPVITVNSKGMITNIVTEPPKESSFDIFMKQNIIDFDKSEINVNCGIFKLKSDRSHVIINNKNVEVYSDYINITSKKFSIEVNEEMYINMKNADLVFQQNNFNITFPRVNSSVKSGSIISASINRDNIQLNYLSFDNGLIGFANNTLFSTGIETGVDSITVGTISKGRNYIKLISGVEISGQSISWKSNDNMSMLSNNNCNITANKDLTIKADKIVFNQKGISFTWPDFSSIVSIGSTISVTSKTENGYTLGFDIKDHLLMTLSNDITIGNNEIIILDKFLDGEGIGWSSSGLIKLTSNRLYSITITGRINASEEGHVYLSNESGIKIYPCVGYFDNTIKVLQYSLLYSTFNMNHTSIQLRVKGKLNLIGSTNSVQLIITQT
jgi:hypothetical protein